MKIKISARAYSQLLLVSIAAAFVTLLFYFYQNRIEDIRLEARAQSVLYADLAAKALDALHGELLSSAQNIAALAESEGASSGQACGPWLAKAANEKQIANIFVFNANRAPACSAFDSNAASPPQAFTRGSVSPDKGRIGSFYDTPNGMRVFPVGYPLRSADGKVVGEIVVAIDSSRSDALRDTLDEHGATMLYIDADNGIGAMRAPTDKTQIYRPQPKEVKSALDKLREGSASGLFPEGFDAAKTSPLSGWTAFVSVPLSVAFEPHRRDLVKQTVLLAALSFMSLVGIWLVSSKLSLATSVLVRAASNAETLFATHSTGVSEIDKGLSEMKRSSRERNEAQATTELWRSASERTRSGMAILRVTRGARPDAPSSLTIILCNPAFEHLSGMGPCLGKDALREAPALAILGDQAAAQELRTCIATGERASRSVQGLDAREKHRHIQLSLEPLEGSQNQDLYCCTLEDVTEIAAREAALELQSTTDTLTHLPNRALFTSLLAKSIDFSERNQTMCAVAMLDIDHFKFINDALGHEMGDLVIAEVARRLESRLRPGDTLSRFGGDDFGIVFADVSSMESISTLVENAREALAPPVAMGGKSFALTFSAGVSVFPDDGSTTKALMSGADIAMFQSKASGRGNVIFHSKSMSQAFSERLVIEQALKTALANDDIFFLYQPKINLATGQPCGMEALARWSHAELGDVSPSKFIPLAEESELIATLGDIAINQALVDAKKLYDLGFRNMPVAINVSARQIKDGFTEKLVHALRKSGLPPSAVHVEITESSVMPNSEVTREFLSELSRLGVKVALDDFGTGWSNMAMLKTLPLSYLKMDRSFIVGLGKDEKDAAIAKAVIGLAKAMGIEVIAEGVETHLQAQQLLYLSADQIQGYYVCKPMPIQELVAWLENGCVFQGAKSQDGTLRTLAPLSIEGPRNES